MLRYTHVTCLGKAVFILFPCLHVRLPCVFLLQFSDQNLVRTICVWCILTVSFIAYSVILCDVIFFGHELIPLPPYPSWRITPCLLSSTAYNVPYSYLPSIFCGCPYIETMYLWPMMPSSMRLLWSVHWTKHAEDASKLPYLSSTKFGFSTLHGYPPTVLWF